MVSNTLGYYNITYSSNLRCIVIAACLAVKGYHRSLAFVGVVDFRSIFAFAPA